MYTEDREQHMKDLEAEIKSLKEKNAKLQKQNLEAKSRISQGVPSKHLSDIQEKSETSQTLQ